eukprot:5598576-Pyramimonas_sp.AAC.2
MFGLKSSRYNLPVDSCNTHIYFFYYKSRPSLTFLGPDHISQADSVVEAQKRLAEEGKPMTVVDSFKPAPESAAPLLTPPPARAPPPNEDPDAPKVRSRVDVFVLHVSLHVDHGSHNIHKRIGRAQSVV